MPRVNVPLIGREYDIVIGSGILKDLNKYMGHLCKEGICIVTDENVWDIYGELISAALPNFGLSIIPPGEESKSPEKLLGLYADFAKAGLTREGCVIALGGGVVGDLAGFAAGTWMRGTGFVQIPTTLLAQVDSSVGGKTAIDLPQGKNLAGMFYQPQLVLTDVDVLQTLPSRERSCGMAEVIKYGAIFSREFFDSLQRVTDFPDMERLITACCEFKRDVVLADERDTGGRMLLNFGHSFGHAAEALGGFSRLRHGEAVSMGMVMAAQAGEILGKTPEGCARELDSLLKAHGLPTECPFKFTELFEQMKLDKKGRGDGLKLVLLESMGTGKIEYITFKELEKLLVEMQSWKI